MSRQKKTPTTEEMVTVFDLLLREDGSAYGIGNSREVARAEGVELIRAGMAKAESECAGTVPDAWLSKAVAVEVAAEVKDVGNHDQ